MTTAAVVGGVDQTTQRILTLLREGKSDGRIAKRLGLSRDEVRARIDGVIRAAHLDEQGRVDELAEQVGLVAPPDEAADAS